MGVEIGVVGRAVRLGAEERVVGRGEDDFQEGIGRAAGPHGRVAPERGLARQQGEALPGGGRRNVDGPRGEDGQRGSDRPQEQQEEAHRFPGGGVGGSHYSLRRDAPGHRIKIRTRPEHFNTQRCVAANSRISTFLLTSSFPVVEWSENRELWGRRRRPWK